MFGDSCNGLGLYLFWFRETKSVSLIYCFLLIFLYLVQALQIWNHPGILQLMKESKDSVRRENVMENFGGDDSSCDENIDYNVIPGGTLCEFYLWS